MHLKNHLRYRSRPNPTQVSFHGTVKIHGTNVTIQYTPWSLPQIRSRSQVITPDNDNGYSAARFLSHLTSIIQTTLQTVITETIEEVVVAGEFAGKGINSGQAAVSDLERFYVIFAISVDGLWLHRTRWQYLRFPPILRIFNIHEFKTWDVTIDFAEERTVGGGKVVGELSLEVENECPVALQLEGIKGGTGEGIVWTEVSTKSSGHLCITNDISRKEMKGGGPSIPCSSKARVQDLRW